MDLMDDLTAILPIREVLQGKIAEPETRKSIVDLLELIKDVMNTLIEYSKQTTTSKPHP